MMALSIVVDFEATECGVGHGAAVVWSGCAKKVASAERTRVPFSRRLRGGG